MVWRANRYHDRDGADNTTNRHERVYHEWGSQGCPYVYHIPGYMAISCGYAYMCGYPDSFPANRTVLAHSDERVELLGDCGGIVGGRLSIMRKLGMTYNRVT